MTISLVRQVSKTSVGITIPLEEAVAMRLRPGWLVEYRIIRVIDPNQKEEEQAKSAIQQPSK